jgi:sn-glycerol 3-phosphate transport system permease protein
MRSASKPLLPGNEFLANVKIGWEKVGFGRALINTFIVSMIIVVGKISLTNLASFAITYFRFRFRMLVFLLIFMSLMLPVEVRIVPTYEAVADMTGPLRWLLDVTGISAVLTWMTGFDVTAGFKISMVNTYAGLSLPLIASACAVFLFRQFFLTVPDDLCEAAKLDVLVP